MNSRAKGARCEREAAAYLRSLGFDGARRSQQYQGTSDSFDITCSSLPNVKLEVKSREDMKIGSMVLDKACMKAAEDAAGRPWAVLWKRNRTPWHLTLEVSMPWVTATVCGDEDVRNALAWLNDGKDYQPMNPRLVVTDDGAVDGSPLDT